MHNKKLSCRRGTARRAMSVDDFLFDFSVRPSCTVFEIIASYLSKVVVFCPPHLHLAPPYELTPVEFRGDLWQQKPSVPGVPCVVVCVILCLVV